MMRAKLTPKQRHQVAFYKGVNATQALEHKTIWTILYEMALRGYPHGRTFDELKAEYDAGMAIIEVRKARRNNG